MNLTVNKLAFKSFIFTLITTLILSMILPGFLKEVSASTISDFSSIALT